jgi:hypothetical protein
MNIELNIPDGISGDWAISNFEIDGIKALFINKFADCREKGREIPPGKYVRLLYREEGRVICYMSNTPAEVKDHEHFINIATGDILITGLGLGMCVQGLLKKDPNRDTVKSITVIEKSQDVINLVAPSITDPRVTIIHADAFTYEPEGMFDYVWHDIWPGIDADNLFKMKTLYKHYEDHSAWQGARALDLCFRSLDESVRLLYEKAYSVRELFKNKPRIMGAA